MFTSTDLKATITDIRPIIERQLDDAVVIAGYREKVTAQGGDWSQVKALVKAMIQDERDDAGGHKRVMAILHKADHALGYADMLGLGNLNEKNSFGDDDAADEAVDPAPHDTVTGEIIDPVGGPTEAQPLSEAEEQAHSSDAGSSAPHPDPADASGTSVGGEDDRGSLSNAGGDAGASSPQPSSVIPFTAKPYDGPVSSNGDRRHPMCRNLEGCHGSWRTGCHSCQKALNVEGGGKEIQHQGSVG